MLRVLSIPASGATGSCGRVSEGAMTRIGEVAPVAIVELNQAPTAGPGRMMTVVNADLSTPMRQSAKAQSGPDSADRVVRAVG